MKRLAPAFFLVIAAGPLHAQPLTPKPELTGVAFLVGDWSTGKGLIADTGGTSTGSSRIELVANGAVLLRRDQTNLFNKAGKPSGSFDQVMMIYPEAGTLHADYSDGTHIIHYTQADIVPGKSVAFSSANAPGAPVFKLSYSLTASDTLGVSFGMIPPGGGSFRPIANGTLHKGS